MGSLPAGAGCVLVNEQLELEAGGFVLVDGIVDMPLVQGKTRPEGKAVGGVVLDDEGSGGGNGRVMPNDEGFVSERIPPFQGGTRRAVIATSRVIPDDEGIVGERIPLFQGERGTR